MSYLVDDTTTRLKSALEKTRTMEELLGRCLAALEGGLAADVHGVPCHELIQQYARLVSFQAGLVVVAADAISKRMRCLNVDAPTDPPQ